MTSRLFNGFNSGSFETNPALQPHALKMNIYIQRRNYLPVYLYPSARALCSCLG